MGNISTYSSPDEGSFTYTYDNQGQLTKAVNGSTTYTYSYDGAGNILTKSDGTTSHSYTYTDYDWRDLLTAYDGQTISYDGAGNPTSYYNGTRWTFTWGNGRQLETASNGSSNLSYNYTADAIRTSKTANGVTHTYYYSGNTLLRETYGSTILDFFYDSNGTPAALKYNGNLYYYITNLQGDVIRLVDANGNTVALYKYDPYGNPIHASGSLATINPLRYRGYYYDTETGLYYLQSRYYDPVVGRFINADEYTSTGQGILGNNMFAYCNNNPVRFTDIYGSIPAIAWGYIGASLVCGTANMLPTMRTGGSNIDCAKTFGVGVLGGLVGFGIAHASKFSAQGSILGRQVSTAICDLGNAWVLKGTINATDIIQASIDITMDTVFSTISYYYTENVSQQLRYWLDPFIDGIVDNIESYLYFESNNISPPSKGGGNRSGITTGTITGGLKYALF